MPDWLLGRLSAALGWASTLVMGVALALTTISLKHTHGELEAARKEAADYKATLDLQATLAKAKDEAFDQAMKDIQPVILHDQKVIQTIRESQPGPDLCASAHQLIHDTFQKEQSQ